MIHAAPVPCGGLAAGIAFARDPPARGQAPSTREADMSVRLKKVADQAIVITGASSGIGLTTARMAARRGARVVLVARNREALESLVHEIGPDAATYVEADVGDEQAVDGVAKAAIEKFGGFDTWVNDAGIG